MSKTAVWTVTVTIAVAVFAIILVVGQQIVDDDPAWLIALAAAAFGACIAIGNTFVSLRFKSGPSGAESTAAAAPTQQAPMNHIPAEQAPPPSQQTGTTFATGGSIAGINAGRDVTIGMPAQDNTTTPKQPDEGV